MKYSKMAIDNFFEAEEIFEREDNLKSESLKYFFIGLFLAMRKFYKIEYDECVEVEYDENEREIFDQFFYWMNTINSIQAVELKESLQSKLVSIKKMMESEILDPKEFYYIVGDIYFKLWSSMKRKEPELAEDILLSSIYEVEKSISHETWSLQKEKEEIEIKNSICERAEALTLDDLDKIIYELSKNKIYFNQKNKMPLNNLNEITFGVCINKDSYVLPNIMSGLYEKLKETLVPKVGKTNESNESGRNQYQAFLLFVF